MSKQLDEFIRKFSLEIDNGFFKQAKDIDEEAQAEALIDFLANHPELKSLGMNSHIRIVGGAVRDVLLGKKPKDIDIVVDEVALEKTNGMTALHFAKKIAEIVPGLNPESIVVDNYFVIHIGPFPSDYFWNGINLRGSKLEIVSARKESYEKNVGYKPTSVEKGTIIDDLQRRDFTINTLTAPLSKLEKGLTEESVEDLLGMGLDDLEVRERQRERKSPRSTGLIKTPADPDIIFSDDPSRILRAIRFMFKYNFELDSKTKEAIIKNKDMLKRMPWEPIVDVFVNKILTLPNRDKALQFMSGLGILRVIGDMTKKDQGMQTRLGSLFRQLNIPVDILVMLKNHGFEFPSYVSKTDHEQDRTILDYKDLMPELAERLSKQRINYKQLVDALGLKNDSINELRMMAKNIIMKDPRKTDEQVIEEIMNVKTASAPVYLAVFLDGKSRNKLLSEFPPIHRKVYAEHMTIAFGDEAKKFPTELLGEEVSLTVVGYAHDDEAQAVVVEGYPSKKKIPHITISCNNAPKNSNIMLENGFEKVSPIKLTGVIDVFPRTKIASQKMYIFDFDDTLFETEPWHDTVIVDSNNVVTSAGDSVTIQKAMDFISKNVPNAKLVKQKIDKHGNSNVQFSLLDGGQPMNYDDLKEKFTSKALKSAGFRKGPSGEMIITSDPAFYHSPLTLGKKTVDSVFKIFAQHIDNSIILTARADVAGMKEEILAKVKELTGKEPVRLYLKPFNGSTSSARYKAEIIIELMKEYPGTNFEFFDDNPSYLSETKSALEMHDSDHGTDFSSRIILHQV